jgi:hypothetical protein
MFSLATSCVFTPQFWLCGWTNACAQECRPRCPDGTKLRATFFAAPKPGPEVLLMHMCNHEHRIRRRQAFSAPKSFL